MPVSVAQKAGIADIVKILIGTTATGRGRRHMASVFVQLVDETMYPEYYKIIPEPRCLEGVRIKNDEDGYNNPIEAYTDLALVFWNAIYYNEAESQISLDAKHLKSVLDSEWKNHGILPSDIRTSPPPRSPQKVHPPKAIPPPKTKPTPTYSTRSVIPPKTREGSSDIDVDGDYDVGASSGRDDREDGDDEIVNALEKGLVGWPGFADCGWMEQVPNARMASIVEAIKIHTDPSGKRPASALEAVPEEPTNPHLAYQSPISLALIEAKVKAEGYSEAKAFDLDFARLFEKARRWHDLCTEPYGHILLLQRLYNALTSSNPPSGPPFTSPTNFASIRAGPGTARPLHSNPGDTEGVPGVTTFRVSTKDRVFVEEVYYKGWSIRLADWVHVSNPDDPSRPIVAQVFKVWISDEIGRKGHPGVTVCWYYRPEQTIHPAQRRFWDGEVFKTSHFADHPLDDLIEKIACQFTARHIRGRPRPPYWYLTWPLYVCDSRYNDRERMFVKIKNWNSCVPEEVRKSTEFMPIYPFERMVYPRLHKSPFIEARGSVPIVTGPGSIGASVEKLEEDVGSSTPGQGSKRRSRRTVDLVGPSRGGFGSGLPALPQQQQQHQQQYHHHHQQSQQNTPLHYAPPKASSRMAPTLTEDRTVITAAGGIHNLGPQPRLQKLPAETVKLFERDATTNEVLWFGAPPVNVARPPRPQYSLTYLHFLAKHSKEANGNHTEPPSKRARLLQEDNDVNMQALESNFNATT